MSHGVLQILIQQSILFSAAVLIAALLRIACLRGLGASAAYMSWLAVPLMLLASALPQPSAGGGPAPVLPQALLAVRAAVQVPVLPDTSARAALAPALLFAWALGAAVIALTLGLRQWRFARRLRRAEDQTHWSLPAGSSPGVIGLWSMRLGLPVDFEQRFSAEEQALILAHEAVHARRHDNAWNLLGSVLCAMHWFNPLAWWALARMRADQELSCDAAVLASADAPEPSLYARTLLKSHTDQPLPELVSMWRPSHPLIERVSLLAKHRPQAARRRLGCALVLGCSLMAAGIVYASQLRPEAPGASEAPLPLRHSKTIAPGYNALTYEVSTQFNGGLPWPQVETLLMRKGSSDAKIAYLTEGPKGGAPEWCVELSIIQNADNSMRVTGRLRDPACKTVLAGPMPVVQDGKTVTRMAGMTPAGLPFVVELLSRRDLDEAAAEDAEARR